MSAWGSGADVHLVDLTSRFVRIAVLRTKNIAFREVCDATKARTEPFVAVSIPKFQYATDAKADVWFMTGYLQSTVRGCTRKAPYSAAS